MTDENNTTPDATPPAPHAEAPPEAVQAEPPAPPPVEQLMAAAHEQAEAATVPPPIPHEAAAATRQPEPEATDQPDEAAAAETVPPEPAEAPAEQASPEPAAEDAATPAAEPPMTAAEAVPEAPPAPPAEPDLTTTPAPRKPRKPKAAPAVASAEESVAEPTAEEAPAAVATAEAEPAVENKKKWYAVKVQSGREESIKAAVERKIKIEGLEPYFGQLLIPVEELIVKKKVKVKNKKTGETTTQEKNVSKYNKKFPGYLFAEVEFNDEILYVFRETPGVGDFVGASLKRAPAPMTDAEVTSMLTGVPDKTKKRGPGKVVVKLDVEKGDKVRIKGGAFANNEGEVKAIHEPKDPTDTPKLTVVVTLWGRPVDVDLDYWEVDKV